MTVNTDALAEIPTYDLQRLYEIADRLIPEAHGMPSAGAVLTADRLRFVFNARPDMLEPVKAALQVGSGRPLDDHMDVLDRFHQDIYPALQLTIVAGYYTDKRVRELIGYPGQMAIEVKSWLVPEYLDEGHIDAVLARGSVWRDPSTGQRAQEPNVPRTYAERFAATKPSEEHA